MERMQVQVRSTESIQLNWDGTPVHAEMSAPVQPAATPPSPHPRVVLLHGLGGSSQYWSKTLSALPNRGYSAIALDLPGHGKSGLPAHRSLTPKWMGQALANWLNTQSNHQHILVGHSLGGWVALQAYLHNPEAIRAVVLVASAGLEGVNLAPPNVLLTADFSTMMQQLLASLFDNPSRVEPAVLQSILTQAMSAPALMTLRPEGLLKPTDLQQINCPTLLIWGQNDRLIPAHWAEVFQNHLPQSQLTILPECGHLPQLEKPAEFHDSLMQFLANLEATPAA